jgi:hypothetical protein
VGSRMLVKVGPSLGLLGTLIPMGTSLASLATGNLEAMAGQMVVAFTTTIIGLATGTLAYVVAATRQTWVAEQVREQRFLAERIAVELGPDALGNDALGNTTLGEELTGWDARPKGGQLDTALARESVEPRHAEAEPR